MVLPTTPYLRASEQYSPQHPLLVLPNLRIVSNGLLASSPQTINAPTGDGVITSNGILLFGAPRIVPKDAFAVDRYLLDPTLPLRPPVLLTQLPKALIVPPMVLLLPWSTHRIGLLQDRFAPNRITLHVRPLMTPPATLL